MTTLLELLNCSCHHFQDFEHKRRFQKSQKKGIYTKSEKVSMNRQKVSFKTGFMLNAAVQVVKKR